MVTPAGIINVVNGPLSRIELFVLPSLQRAFLAVLLVSGTLSAFSQHKNKNKHKHNKQTQKTKAQQKQTVV